MLAFLGPVQITFLLLVLLIIFGPQKLPEIGMQLGRALRELRRAGQELSNSFSLDDYDRPYEPPRYDPPRYDGYTSGYSGDSAYQAGTTDGPRPLPGPEPPRGDAAAAALADPGPEYSFLPPEGSVPRARS